MLDCPRDTQQVFVAGKGMLARGKTDVVLTLEFPVGMYVEALIMSSSARASHGCCEKTDNRSRIPEEWSDMRWKIFLFKFLAE